MRLAGTDPSGLGVRAGGTGSTFAFKGRVPGHETGEKIRNRLDAGSTRVCVVVGEVGGGVSCAGRAVEQMKDVRALAAVALGYRTCGLRLGTRHLGVEVGAEGGARGLIPTDERVVVGTHESQRDRSVAAQCKDLGGNRVEIRCEVMRVGGEALRRVPRASRSRVDR